VYKMFVHVKMITEPEKGKQKIVSTEDLSYFHKKKNIIQQWNIS